MFADLLVSRQSGEHAHKGHGGGEFPLATTLGKGLKGLQTRDLQRLIILPAFWQISAQLLATLMKIFKLLTILLRTDEWNLLHLRVGDRNTEAVTETAHMLQPHLLLGVGCILPLTSLAHSIPLDRLGQDHRRLSLVCLSSTVGRINFAGIMTTTLQLPDILICHIRY